MIRLNICLLGWCGNMEAKCLNCGAVFELEGDVVPEGVRCFCNGANFKVERQVEA